jgi:hypothetical protein
MEFYDQSTKAARALNVNPASAPTGRWIGIIKSMLSEGVGVLLRRENGRNLFFFGALVAFIPRLEG